MKKLFSELRELWYAGGSRLHSSLLILSLIFRANRFQ